MELWNGEVKVSRLGSALRLTLKVTKPQIAGGKTWDELSVMLTRAESKDLIAQVVEFWNISGLELDDLTAGL